MVRVCHIACIFFISRFNYLSAALILQEDGRLPLQENNLFTHCNTMFEKLSALPSTLQLLKDPVSIVVFGIFFSLMLLEELFPGRKLPGIRYWRWMGITAFVVNFFLATYLPMLWNEYLAPYQWFDMTFLGNYWGGLAALLAFVASRACWEVRTSK